MQELEQVVYLHQYPFETPCQKSTQQMCETVTCQFFVNELHFEEHLRKRVSIQVIILNFGVSIFWILWYHELDEKQKIVCLKIFKMTKICGIYSEWQEMSFSGIKASLIFICGNLILWYHKILNFSCKILWYHKILNFFLQNFMVP